jgi:hypothetical protein
MQTIPVTSQIPPQMDRDELARVADKYRTVTFDLVPWESIETCQECVTWARTGADADGEAELIYTATQTLPDETTITRTIRQSVCGVCLDLALGALVAQFPTHPELRDTLVVRVLLAVEGAA